MYGIFLVLTIALLGGVIALLGDRVGMKVGKKRLSLCGLRPKYTSMIVTVVTGIFISGTTLLLLTLVSNDVRTALFQMKTLQRELSMAQAELRQVEIETKTLQENKVALEVERDRLRKEIQAYSGEASLLQANGYGLATSQVMFAEGEILATMVVPADAQQKAVQDQLTALVQTANRVAMERGARSPGKADEALVWAEGFSDLPTFAAQLADAGQAGVLRLVVARDTEVLTPVTVAFVFFPNQRVFEAGEVISAKVLPPLAGESELVDRMVALWTDLRQTALAEGMRAEGPALGEFLAPAQVSSLLAEMHGAEQPLVLRLVAAADLWRVDAELEIELQLEGQAD